MTKPKDPSAVALGKKRWAGISKAESSRAHSAAARALWDAISLEERSKIMKARAAKRKSNKEKKS